MVYSRNYVVTAVAATGGTSEDAGVDTGVDVRVELVGTLVGSNNDGIDDEVVGEAGIAVCVAANVIGEEAGTIVTLIVADVEATNTALRSVLWRRNHGHCCWRCAFSDLQSVINDLLFVGACQKHL